MRLLVLTSFIPQNEEDPYPQFVREQLIELKKINPTLDIHVLAPHTDETIKTSPSENKSYREHRYTYFWPKKFQTLPKNGILPSIKNNFLYVFQVPFLCIFCFTSGLKFTLKKRPDLIYAHWYTPQGIVALIIAILTKTPFAFTSHSMDIAILKKLPLLGKFLVRKGIKKSAAVTVVSKKTLEKIKPFYGQSEWPEVEKLIHIIPMGTKIPPPSLTKEHPNEIVFIGRLADKKGVEYLLESILILKERSIEYTLNICGTGTLEKTLKDMAISLNIEDHVIFHGFLSGKKKDEILNRCTISVIPSIDTPSDTEGLPVVAMESLAYGKVLIATDACGLDRSLPDSKACFVIPQKNANALADTLELVKNMKESDITEMKNSALLSAQKFAWSSIARKYAEILKLVEK